MAERQRMDTRLESEAAEFLVLGHLLTAGMEEHKAYTRFPGFDVLALNPGDPNRALLLFPWVR